jgi:replicative DNA helicase Mcm
VHPPSSRRKATLSLYDVRAVSTDLVGFFHSNFPELARKASEKRVPGPVFHADEACRIEFLLGAYRGDGFYDSARFGLTTSSEGLARDYADLLLSLGVYSYIARSTYPHGHPRTGTHHKIVISGARSQRRFFELVARRDPRADTIRAFVERSERQPMDADRLPHEVVLRLKGLLAEFGLDVGDLHQRVVGRARCHRTTVERGLLRVEGRLASLPPLGPTRSTPRAVRNAYRIRRSDLARDLGRSVSWIGLHDQEVDSSQSKEILRATTERARAKDARVREELRALRRYVESPLRFLRIRKVEVIPNDREVWVYDVTVEPTHTFVSDGLVLHNTVSIAKAGITSTLNARCPVLAAANPKWGRFTGDHTISEQIDLPPTLLSRFDVIFSIKDVPDQDRDRRLANRILASHRDIESETLGLPPGPGGASAAPFKPELLKKYIAYARRTIKPSLSQEALDALEDYYVKVRRQGEEPNAPVPITARQLEALVRLSEAAARARLSPVVEVEDSRRAIHIVETFLRRVSMTEEGKLDIDLTQSGVSHSQRERLDIVMRIMRELQDEHGGFFTIEQFRTATERSGIPAPKAEALLQSLRNQGEIIEARPNQLQLVRF